MDDDAADVGRWDTSRWTLIYGTVLVGASLLSAVVWNGRWYVVAFTSVSALGFSWMRAEQKRGDWEPARPDVAPHIAAEIKEREQRR